MTVGPIDLQVIVPKATEVSKFQHSLKENKEAQKNILTTGFQEQLQTSKHKVNKRTRAEKAKILKDQSKSKKDDAKKKQNKKRKKKKVNLKRSSGHRFDIRI